MTEHDPDDSPIMFVHPDDVDLAELKGNFAAMGISIQTSPNVQRGQAYLHDEGEGPDGWRMRFPAGCAWR